MQKRQKGAPTKEAAWKAAYNQQHCNWKMMEQGSQGSSRIRYEGRIKTFSDMSESVPTIHPILGIF